ncbi:hypothetical protein DM860_007919 [Cuscuta australis]|uniref:Uncharacterized protein n=1 Tax=Cuscuta australis TaxID=267555 RepID=A0A328DWY6_9ASTE|nr:hypothetical protein DM860_007919 [Cuscuta australis]
MVAKHAFDSHTYYYTEAQIVFYLSAKQEHNLPWLQETVKPFKCPSQDTRVQEHAKTGERLTLPTRHGCNCTKSGCYRVAATPRYGSGHPKVHEAQITFTISEKQHRAQANPAMAARRQLPRQDAGRLALEI